MKVIEIRENATNIRLFGIGGLSMFKEEWIINRIPIHQANKPTVELLTLNENRK